MNEKSKNRWEDLQEWWLNRRPVVYMLFAFTVVLAVANLWLKLHAAYKTVARPDHHYAQEIADEYYVLLHDTFDEKVAVALRDQLAALSMRILGSEAAARGDGEQGLLRRHRASETQQEEMGDAWLHSTEIGVGFTPDQVFYCLADNESGWIVGLDLQSGQGEALETMGRLDEIRETVGLLQPGDKEVDKLVSLLASAQVRYFDAVSYKKQHKVPILFD